jgi:hypothetical protein
MTPIGEVPAGVLVFLECGFAGIRGVSSPNRPAPVMVGGSCPAHPFTGLDQLLMLGPSELVSMFAREDDPIRDL